jgi:hypothetical protein
MDVFEIIRRMENNIIQGLSQDTSDRICLYSSGLKAKLTNAEYAFYRLNELSGESDSSISTSGFGTGEIIHFYLDSFFAFLYSAFDVMGQIVNQKLNLSIPEDKVSFKKVNQILDQNHAGIRIQQLFGTILNSRFFKELEKYRNCSTHRRQIYIQSRTTLISGTPGYTTSGDLTRIERIICDDPLTLIPTVIKNKELIGHCLNMLIKAKEILIKISKAL